ncbi:MAG: tail fiber protein [Bacteroidetes bacterium]|nr:tail fiber protein [Bacteroidota bacterium]
MIGEIKLFAGNYVPAGFLLCDGSVYKDSDYIQLFTFLKGTYGGDGVNTFAVPNLLGRVPVCTGKVAGKEYNLGEMAGTQWVTLDAEHVGVHVHMGQFAADPQMHINLQIPASTGAASTTTPAGNMFANSPAGYEMYNNTPPGLNQPIAMQGIVKFNTSQQTDINSTHNHPHPNDQPYQCINYIIDAEGLYDEPLVGEICIFPYQFIPKNFIECNGAVLNFMAYWQLFNLLDTTYGSNGVGTFALPDLRGKVAAGSNAGKNTGINNRSLGESGGATSVALTPDQIPAHTHPVNIEMSGKVGWPVTPNVANTGNPAGAMLAKVGGETMYNTTSNSTMAEAGGGSLTGVMQILPNTSGDNAHNNVQPVMGLTYAINTYGIFPPRQ